MKRKRPYQPIFVALATVFLTLARVATEERPEPTVLTPEDLVWTEQASGVYRAVLQGDPDEDGPFTLRLRYPAGYRKAPHYHPGDATVTVLSGRYFRGYGNSFDEANGIELTPGTFSSNPAEVAHYEWTTEPAELQVHANGPWSSVYVDMEGNRLASPQP